MSTNKRRTRRADLALLKEKCESADLVNVVTDIEMEDEQLSFTLKLPDQNFEQSATVVIPSDYPKGDGKLLAEGMVTLGPGTVGELVQLAINEICRHRSVAAPSVWPLSNELQAPSVAPTVSRTATMLYDYDVFENVDTRTANLLDTEVETYAKTVTPPATALCIHVPTGDVVVRVSMPMSFLDDRVADIWHIHNKKQLVVDMVFTPAHYHLSDTRPSFDLYLTSDTDLGERVLLDRETFSLVWTLRQKLLKAEWPPVKTSEAKIDFPGTLAWYCNFLKESILHCNRRCLICDDELDFKGLKPAVCGNPLCVHAYETYGFGEDVMTFIRHNPELMDLLICMTYTASTGDMKRFNPYPFGIETRVKNSNGVEETFSFATDSSLTATAAMQQPPLNPYWGHNNKNFKKVTDDSMEKKKDTEKIRKCLDTIPSIQELLTCEDTAQLRQLLTTKHPLAFPLLRWIITSNRAHFTLIPAEKQAKEMHTDMQFIMLSSSPENEAQFDELKSHHGSFFAWHGSNFANWHAILRKGLRNYSNTDMMTCGAAFGAGIYLATNSATSLGYAMPTNTWPSTQYGGSSMQCLALCEVIDYKEKNHRKYVAHPHYVIPNEAHVATRYFFVFKGGGQHHNINVNADSVSLIKQQFARTVSSITPNIDSGNTDSSTATSTSTAATTITGKTNFNKAAAATKPTRGKRKTKK